MSADAISRIPQADNNGVHTVHIRGVLQHSEDIVDRSVASGHAVDLDFSGCSLLSVEGLEWLEELMLRAESVGSRVRFINIPPTIYKVFKVAHIDSLLRASGSPGVRGPVC